MHEGLLPAITELILGLCFGINLGLHFLEPAYLYGPFAHLYKFRRVMQPVNCLNSCDLRSFILFRDYGTKWDYSCQVLVVLVF